MFDATAWFSRRYGILFRLKRLFGRGLNFPAGFLSADLGPLFSRITGKNRVKKDAEVSDAFDLYGNSILRLAYSYLHNMADAEDILQETLIRYMNRAPEFENQNHEKAWLLRVAANLSKNRIGYNALRKADELNEELIASEHSSLSFVWEAVKSLSEAQRAVIHLFYQEGFSTAQIAKTLDEKESTVRSHLKRGREKLRDILKEDYDFDEI